MMFLALLFWIALFIGMLITGPLGIFGCIILAFFAVEIFDSITAK